MAGFSNTNSIRGVHTLPKLAQSFDTPGMLAKVSMKPDWILDLWAKQFVELVK